MEDDISIEEADKNAVRGSEASKRNVDDKIVENIKIAYYI